MTAAKKATALIATFAGKSTSAVREQSTLAALGLASSLRLMRLQRALVAEAGLRDVTIAAHWTVGRIIAALPSTDSIAVAEVAAADPPVATDRTPVTVSMTLGVDIEEVDGFPETTNVREHEFYSRTFSPSELSYALLAANPRQRLCGMFCAKEALRKCGPSLAALDFLDIEITRQQDAPGIRIADESLNSAFEFLVSISHTDRVATASVIALPRQ